METGAGFYAGQRGWRGCGHLRGPARCDVTPRGLGGLQPRPDLSVEVIRVDDPRTGGGIKDDHGVHEQCLIGVGDTGKVADRWRPGVQHPQSGDFPLGQCRRQLVGIDEVLGPTSQLGAISRLGRRFARTSQVVGYV